jgi:hypothetical protein
MVLASRSIGESERHADTLGRYSRRYERGYYAALDALRKYRRQKSAERSHQPDETKGSGLQNEPAPNP